MIIAWSLFVAGVILSTYFVFLGRHNKKCRFGYTSWHGRFVLAGVISIGLTAITGLVASVNTFAPMYEEGRCYNWGRLVERDVKFIRDSFWSWDCYVHSDEGWITRDNTIKVDD